MMGNLTIEDITVWMRFSNLALYPMDEFPQLATQTR